MQLNFMKHGTRDYQVAKACEGAHTHEFLAQASGLMFRGSALVLLEVRNEVAQLSEFMLASWFGGSGYEFVRVRTRNCPYRLAGAIANLALARELASLCEKRLCSNAASFRSHCKASLDGCAAMAEGPCHQHLGRHRQCFDRALPLGERQARGPHGHKQAGRHFGAKLRASRVGLGRCPSPGALTSQ